MSSESVLNSPAHLTRQDAVLTERRARHVWVSIVVGLLGLQVLGGIISVFLAFGDPSAAIVPNYHQSALNWDVTRRQRQLPQRLGWHIETSVSESLDNSHHRLLNVRISKDEASVGGQKLTARVFHHARGQDVRVLQLTEADPGVYTAIVDIEKAGVWQIELRIDGDHGVAAESIEIIVH